MNCSTSHHQLFWLAGWVLFILGCGHVKVFGQGDDQAASTFDSRDLEFFENRVRPLLVEKCLECHDSEAGKTKGGLSLNSREQMLAGGDSGPAIIPGRADDSLLMSAVHYDELEMPPSGQLAAKEIEALKIWIDRGAADPRKPGPSSVKPYQIDIETGKEFWSFRPVRKRNPSEPATGDSFAWDSWYRTDIDRWVGIQLRKKGLTPVADADRYHLLRRVHFALTGLPPSEAEIKEFTSSRKSLDSDLERVVDALLASPHFGERWGRHWLDVARFAESSGGGRSLMFPDAWRYRDYVIRSFNADKPIQRFITEQLAGDLLPFATQEERNENLVATGFLALGPTNYEQQDKELLRMEVIDEQVDTVGRAFLGMTLGCARCHDHKFDPIPTKDYYALAGIFGSTVSLVDGNVSSYVKQPLATQEAIKAANDHNRLVKQINQKIAAARKRIQELSEPRVHQIVRSSDLDGLVVDDTSAELIGNWTKSVSVKSYVDHGYIHDQNQPKGSNQAIFRFQIPAEAIYEVRIAYSPGPNRATNARIEIHSADGVTEHIVDQTRPPKIDGVFQSLGQFRFVADLPGVITVSNAKTSGVVIADAVQLLRLDTAPGTPQVSTKEKAGPEPQRPGTSELEDAEQQLARWLTQREELQANAPPPIEHAMSVKDAARPSDGRVLVRGNVRNLGEQVPRGFLQVLGPFGDDRPQIPGDASGRLELARWIASEQNPLTARVYVNRIWRHMLGRGLVESADNFGSMGRPPSHPELLDDLAADFVQNGWSTKQLIRKIVLSRVFRLATTLDSTAAEVDPENHLLWRAHRRRMDAEVLRDTILSAAGQLDLTMGGRTIRRITQYDLGYEFNTVRRSVYVPAFRNSMLELFATFDIANPNMVTGHRITSTLPTQALYLMNSPWVMDQAENMAKFILSDTESMDQRVYRIYLRLLGRPPLPREQTVSLKFLERMQQDEGMSNEQALTALIHSVIGTLDFRYIN